MFKQVRQLKRDHFSASSSRAAVVRVSMVAVAS